MILILLLAMSSACGTGSGRNIKVFAAASLADAFAEMALGRQRLRAQLELGAMADVFASANTVQMDLAVEADLVWSSPATFTTSSLAVIASGNAETGRIRSLEDLTAPGVRLVLAHPSVPAGAYARRLLENLSEEGSPLGKDFGSRVLANLASEETNVRNVEQKVILGEADAAVVYRSGAERALAESPGNIKLVPLSAVKNVHVTYPIAVLNNSERPALAAAFVAFVLSPQGQEILSRHGFTPG